MSASMKDLFPGPKTEWFGYDRYDFTFEGCDCIVIDPKVAAKGRPWIWRGLFFGHEPQADLELLSKGFHLVQMNVIDYFGAPIAVERWNKFYDFLTEKHGFARKTVLEGFSRAGLAVLNWAAANTDKVACIYLDAPVCDFKSWPGGKGKSKGDFLEWQKVLKYYGFKNDYAALDYKLNPIDNMGPLVKAGIPIIDVCGDADSVVPMDENSTIYEKRYKELGGHIEFIVKPGCEHHPHSLIDPKPIVDFILRYVNI